MKIAGRERKPNLKARAEYIKAMDIIARSISDEDIFEIWLMNGVPDGAVEEDTPLEDLYWMCDDETFADLMSTFCRVMKYAFDEDELSEEDKKYGNNMLYEDGILSKRREV